MTRLSEGVNCWMKLIASPMEVAYRYSHDRQTGYPFLTPRTMRRNPASLFRSPPLCIICNVP